MDEYKMEMTKRRLHLLNPIIRGEIGISFDGWVNRVADFLCNGTKLEDDNPPISGGVYSYIGSTIEASASLLHRQISSMRIAVFHRSEDRDDCTQFMRQHDFTQMVATSALGQEIFLAHQQRFLQWYFFEYPKNHGVFPYNEGTCFVWRSMKR